MPESEDRQFETVVAGFLAEGLHTRRGLSTEEYTAVCRRAWDECQASPAFPFKVLVDPLSSIESMLAHRRDEYVHWRVSDALEVERDESKAEIRCTALGPVKPDLSTGPDDRPPLPTDEPDVPEIRRYALAVFDVLGFSALLQQKGLREISALYSRLIAEAVTKDAMRIDTLVRFSDTQQGTAIGALPVRHAHFSDTIFLWVPLVQHFIAAFMARCADMVCEALKMELPLRGAVAVGQAVMHVRTGTFVGAPIVEAARLEQSQDWLGVSLGPSMLAADVSREFDPHLVVPYSVPFKKGKQRVFADLALDWPSRFRTRYGTDPVEAIRAVDRSPAHHVYYANAVKFAEYSAGPIFRSDGLHRPPLGELAAAALEARREQTPLGRTHQFILKDLSRAGTVGESVARYVQAIAKGEEPPTIADHLPRGMMRFLRELSLAADGDAKLFKLVPCAVEAARMRFLGTPFSLEANALLADLEQLDNSRPVAGFLRDLAAGGEPAVPPRLQKEAARFLKQAWAWVKEGKLPPGLLGHVAEDCLNAGLGHGGLEPDVMSALAAIEASGGSWPSVAAFLRAIAAGEHPAVPASLAKPTESLLVRVSLSARLAGVQQPRAFDIIAVGLGDPATGVDLYALAHDLVALAEKSSKVPQNAQRAIQRFEAAAPERAVVAHRLQSLVTQEPIVSPPGRLPVALRLLLAQLDALAQDKPIPLDPSLVGLAAIRSRHGGGAMGDCIMFSLGALARAGPEYAALAEYLWGVANGGPAGPAPFMTNPRAAETAEEVRCLADPEVGGMRLMMAPAGQAAESP